MFNNVCVFHIVPTGIKSANILKTPIVTYMTAVFCGKYFGNSDNELLFTWSLVQLPDSLEQLQERGQPNINTWHRINNCHSPNIVKSTGQKKKNSQYLEYKTPFSLQKSNWVQKECHILITFKITVMAFNHLRLQIITHYYMTTIVSALWLVAKQARFSCNDRAQEPDGGHY